MASARADFDKTQLAIRVAIALDAFLAMEAESSKVPHDDPRLVSNLAFTCHVASDWDWPLVSRRYIEWAAQKELFSSGSPLVKSTKSTAKASVVCFRGVTTLRGADSRLVAHISNVYANDVIHGHDLYSRVCLYALIDDEYKRVHMVSNEASISGSAVCSEGVVAFVEAIRNPSDLGHLQPAKQHISRTSIFHDKMVKAAIVEGLRNETCDYFLPSDGPSVVLNAIMRLFSSIRHGKMSPSERSMKRVSDVMASLEC